MTKFVFVTALASAMAIGGPVAAETPVKFQDSATGSYGCVVAANDSCEFASVPSRGGFAADGDWTLTISAADGNVIAQYSDESPGPQRCFLWGAGVRVKGTTGDGSWLGLGNVSLVPGTEELIFPPC